MTDHPSGVRPPARVTFGVFELDLRTGELRKAGARVRLSGQPLKLLERLVARPGELVTREELRQQLWSDDTFVDFERNLNSAMKRLRSALGDSADHPRYIETLPRRGYRFLAPVSQLPVADGQSGVAAAADVQEGPLLLRQLPEVPRRSRKIALGAALVLVLAVTAFLAGWPRARPARSVRSLAVLPFVLADPASREDEYIAFGLSEALITELSRMGGIRVTSQTSSMQYKDAGKGLQAIARELGVDVVVEGSVQREGNRIRITVQLIEAASDTHLWADSYERDVGGVLSLVDDVALAVAREIHVAVAPGRTRRAAAGPLDAEVAEAYLRGRYHLGQGTEESYQRAVTYFERALELDPAHARSHAGLADFYIVTDRLLPDEASANARLHATKAVALDDSLPDAHASLAFLHFYYDWDWPAAEREFRRAVALDPGLARAHRWFALFLSAMKRDSEAQASLRPALAADPVGIANHDAAATVGFNGRRYDDTIAAARAIQDLNTFDPRAYEQMGIGLLFKGHDADALAALERGLEFTPSSISLRLIRVIALSRVGRVVDAESALAQIQATPPGGYVPEVFLAIAEAALGRTSRALDHLDRAYQERDPYLVLINASPWFDGLRADPRFVRLLDDMKFPGQSAAQR